MRCAQEAKGGQSEEHLCKNSSSSQLGQGGERRDALFIQSTDEILFTYSDPYFNYIGNENQKVKYKLPEASTDNFC
jgi:hypothetical protein